MNAPLRLAFAGTPLFAVPTLQALIESPHDVSAVLTQPDRPKGRGRQASASPVKMLAQQASIPVLQPHTLRDVSTQQALRALLVDVIVVVAYGLWVPPADLTLPKFGCINIHASILPRHRGAAPIVQALLAGDEATGVSIMAMDKSMDTGPVYRAISHTIAPTDNAITLTETLSQLGSEALLDLLDAFANDQVPAAKAQPEQGATLAPKINKDDANINWHNTATQLERHIRAYALWPVARATFAGEMLKIHEATVRVDATTQAPPGSVIAVNADGIDVATGDGVLRLIKIQRPGGRALAVKDCWHQSCFQSDGQALRFTDQA